MALSFKVEGFLKKTFRLMRLSVAASVAAIVFKEAGSRLSLARNGAAATGDALCSMFY
jgi:hypothetical protein